MTSTISKSLLVVSLALAATVFADEESALSRVKLPGVTLNTALKCVDVDSTICLQEGALELIACTKDTKEHEAILMVNAKPVHIHMALLLMGAMPGNPASREPVGQGDDLHWVERAPAGQPIEVSVVMTDAAGKQTEKPIANFIRRIEDTSPYPGKADEKSATQDRAFPTSQFLFTGSLLLAQKEGPKKYLADESGSVITISTFGDELLGMPDFIGQDNEGLVWEVDPEHVPAVGTKVLLRLKPVVKP